MAQTWKSYATLLTMELSGERAQHHVQALAPFYRSPGSSGFDSAIDHVISSLKDSPLEVEVPSFPLDGRTALFGETVPRAWEPRGARLEMVSPSRVTLVEWDDCPSCLPWWCRPTPPEGVDLAVVDVGTGTSDADYKGHDVAGKAVLVHDCGENFAWRDIVSRAARNGAAGIVSNYLLYQYEPWRTRTGLPAAVQQMRLPANGDSPWTFTISHDAFMRVHGALDSGETAILRFTIDAKTFDSTSRYVLATIPGSDLPEESITFVSHVTAATKPGSNCASGVGLLIELARTIGAMIEGGQIERPRRSLNFLFGNEGLCSQHWYAGDPHAARNIHATLSFCSVGHDEGITKSSLIMARSPDSLPTFMNDLLETLIDETPREAPWAYRQGSRDISLMHWTVLPYTPWSDNATWSKLGVPGILFMSLPDRYFHTQLLTPEKTDPAVFRRCGAVTGAAALAAATASWPGAADIMRNTATRSRSRLDRLALRLSQEARNGSTEGIAYARDALEWTLERDGRALRTVLKLVAKDGDSSLKAAKALVDLLESENRNAVAWASEGLVDLPFIAGPRAAEDEASRMILRRIKEGVPHGIPGLGFEEMIALVDRMAKSDASVRVETLNVLADEIWNLSPQGLDLGAVTRTLCHEFSLALRTEDVRQLAEAFARSGYVKLSEP